MESGSRGPTSRATRAPARGCQPSARPRGGPRGGAPRRGRRGPGARPRRSPQRNRREMRVDDPSIAGRGVADERAVEAFRVGEAGGVHGRHGRHAADHGRSQDALAERRRAGREVGPRARHPGDVEALDAEGVRERGDVSRRVSHPAAGAGVTHAEARALRGDESHAGGARAGVIGDDGGARSGGPREPEERRAARIPAFIESDTPAPGKHEAARPVGEPDDGHGSSIARTLDPRSGKLWKESPDGA